MAPLAKRRRTEQPEEITFNPSARQEYLTGFHKRKVQRKEHAREIAARRDKEEKVKERKQLREQRKEDLERHVTEVNAELKKQKRNLADSSDAESDAEDGEWEGVQKPEVAKVLPDDEEYVDEDKYTTVTVEAMDGEAKDAQDDDDELDQEADAKAGAPANGEGAKTVVKKRVWKKAGQTKGKKKKFRYESKAERSATRQKQKAKNHKAKLQRTGK